MDPSSSKLVLEVFYESDDKQNCALNLEKHFALQIENMG